MVNQEEVTKSTVTVVQVLLVCQHGFIARKIQELALDLTLAHQYLILYFSNG